MDTRGRIRLSFITVNTVGATPRQRRVVLHASVSGLTNATSASLGAGARIEAMAARSLFRTMLREAAQVDQYNFRNYAIRRVREDFRRNAALAGADADAALQEGKEALEVLRRQRIVGQLYPAAQSVMDAEASRAFEDAAESVIDPVGSAGR